MEALLNSMSPNTAVKAAPFGRWTLRDKALRSAPTYNVRPNLESCSLRK